MKNFWKNQPLSRRNHLLLLLFILFTAFRIFLFLQTPLAGAAQPKGDDRTLIWHAWQLEQGGWLGAYQDSTLTLGMSFPIFLLVCRRLCLPFMLGIAILYIGSILFFLRTWKPVFPSRGIRGFLYLFLLYSPVMMGAYTAQRAWDLTLMPSLILLLLALGMGLYQHRNTHLLSFLLGLSLTLTFFFYLRRDSYWILFPVLVFLIFLGVLLKKEHTGKKICFLLLPFLVVTIAGLGIAALNHHYYQKFTVYTDGNEGASDFTNVSSAVKDTLFTAWRLSSNQMPVPDTITGSGSAEDLRLMESITGSQVIYPNENPLLIKGWAFPTRDSENLELAVTDVNGQPLAYAQYENSEDVYQANPEYSAARVCRFALEAPVQDASQVSLTLYLNGVPVKTYPIELIAEETEDYHLFLEDAGVKQDPVLSTAQWTVRISQAIQFLYRIVSLPLAVLSFLSFFGLLGIAVKKNTSSRLRKFAFLTAAGITALLAVTLYAVRYPSLAGLDPAAYSSGPWMLIQILILCSILWFVPDIWRLQNRRHVKTAKKTGKSTTGA